MEREKVVTTTKRMTKARAVLVRDYPFFGQLSLGLQLACAPCGTACTDGERLIFDPEFAEQLLSDEEMEFVILHEVLHCVLEHCTRGGVRDSYLFNLACDIVVNSTILDMWGLNTFQVAGDEPVHLAPDGMEGREYSAEEVYQMLLQNDGQERPSGYSDMGTPHGDQRDSRKGNREIDRHDIWKCIREEQRIQDKWNNRIREVLLTCQEEVQLPQNIRRLTEKLAITSKADWKQLLHDFLQYDMYDYSFLPPDRRFTETDFFLPAYNPDEDHLSAKGIWVCMDTSASITDVQLKEAMSEVLDAMRQTGLTGYLSFFDTELTEPVPFHSEEEFKVIPPKGGGGTSFHVIFQYLKEKLYPKLPRAILIFTDGYVWNWPKEEDAMEVPVLWLIKKGGNTSIPWGKVAEL